MLRGIDAGCNLTGLGSRTVWSLTRCNALPHRRCGRAILFVVAEVQAWIDAGCPTDPGAAEQVRAAMGKGGQRR
jgi:predicted DNA-binding transcriptional regulator AlpA